VYSQLVNSPTRDNNILDIFATNRPSLILDCKVIPGISDHEAVYVETQINLISTPETPRQIFFWDKADFNDLMMQYSTEFLSIYSPDTPVEVLWTAFKTKCHECLDHKLYLQKTTLKHHGLMLILNKYQTGRREHTTEHIPLDFHQIGQSIATSKNCLNKNAAKLIINMSPTC